MSLRTAIITPALATLLATATGCGTVDCQSTCDKIYGEAPGCGEPKGTPGEEGYLSGLIGPSGSTEKMLRQCQDECTTALQTPGEVGNYAPTEYTPSTEVVELENDKQAALWMDCVSEFDCANLESGYCAPIW
jgi:hypothetical protein